MARLANNNELFKRLQGSLGKEIVLKQYPDKVVVSKYPDMSKVKPSPKQVEGRQRMKEATAYALSILRNPVLKAAFEHKIAKGESVYHKAKKEYFEQLKNNTSRT